MDTNLLSSNSGMEASKRRLMNRNYTFSRAKLKCSAEKPRISLEPTAEDIKRA